eukprot:scpid21118/ scgid34961/ Polyribonucleotide 5&apos; Polynucleotide kinase Clp1; Pre-mRNA cleavage complex II protein Clp1
MSLPKKTWELSPLFELRMEVEDTALQVKLLDGTAEMFGTELVIKEPVNILPFSKVAFFSWHGCTLETIGEIENIYIAKETPMQRYLNVHTALHQQREAAVRNNSDGPRVMVVGSPDVGKSTLCRILLNYATRLGYQPMFVDLDVGQATVGLPGCIGALPVERPADIQEGFSRRAPLVYHFGHLGPDRNIKFYKRIMEVMSNAVKRRSQSLPVVRGSGYVINTCGWVKGGGYALLLDVFSLYDVDIVIVLDNDLLYNKLQQDLPLDKVKLVELPKSGGVVARNRVLRSKTRERLIHEYFYGLQGDLFPHSFDVSFDAVKIFKVGAPVVPDSCLPLGMSQDESEVKLVKVNPSKELVHCILAVSVANEATAENQIVEDLRDTNITGFISVTDVDAERRKIRVLSPQPEPLPRSNLLLSDARFMDS